MCLPRQYMHAGLAPDEHYLAKPDSGLSTDHMCSQTVETNVYIGVAQPLRCRQAGSGQSCRLRSLALTLRPVHLRLDASSVGETLLGPFVAEADC